jgi:hypothetical protein
MSIAKHQLRLIKARGAVDRRDAIAFEKSRATAAVATTHDIDAVLTGLAGDHPVELFRMHDDRIVRVDQALLRRHLLLLGGSGFGKSFLKALQFVQMFASAARSISNSNGTQTTLGFECVTIDIKSETAQLQKCYLAALYLRADQRVREALQASGVHWIGLEHDRITPISTFGASDAVSNEYRAKVMIDVLANASRSKWPESLLFLGYQVFRVLGERKDPLNLRVIEAFLRDERVRMAFVSEMSASDLAEFFGRLPQRVAPQTIEAFIRRIAIELGYPLVRLALGLPPSIVASLGVPQDAAITLVDAGASNALPPSIAAALANWILTNILFAITRRDPRTPLSIFLEEAAALLGMSEDLLDLVMNALRMCRSLGVNLEFATQSLDSLAGPIVRELVLNAVTITAFLSPESVAAILYPHLLPNPSDGRSEHERHRDFVRDVTSLRRQEVVFWAKGHPAFRARTLDLVAPEEFAGVPSDELADIRAAVETALYILAAPVFAVRWLLDRRAAWRALEPLRRGTIECDICGTVNSLVGLGKCSVCSAVSAGSLTACLHCSTVFPTISCVGCSATLKVLDPKS